MRRAALLVLACAAGCGGGGDGSASRGGFVRLEHRRLEDGGASVSARAELSTRPPHRPPDGRCEPPETPQEGTWLDVGESITLSAPGSTIVLARASVGERVIYGVDGLPGDAAPAGAIFDVEIEGTEEVGGKTLEDAIVVPPAFEAGPVPNAIGTGEDVTLTWTPGGADEMLVELASAGTLPQLICRTDDGDGSLTIPGELNDALSSGAGIATFRAVRRRTAAFEGRRVSVEGHFVRTSAWD